MIDPTQMGAPPAGMAAPPDQGMPPDAMPPEAGAMPPETLDGQGADPTQQVGMSLDPGTLAQIALAAIAQVAGIDQQMFSAAQKQAIEQVGPAIDAILGQLAGGPPETMDGAPQGLAAPAEPDAVALS